MCVWLVFCSKNLTFLQVLAMRKRIKGMGFKDWDTMFYNNVLPIPLLAVFSFIMEDWGSTNLSRNLSVGLLSPVQFDLTFIGFDQPNRFQKCPALCNDLLWCSSCIHLLHHCMVCANDEQYDIQVRTGHVTVWP